MVSKPFESVCTQGAVFRWEGFENAGFAPKDKFVIILDADIKDPVLFVVTTSQTIQYRSSKINTVYYTIKAGKYPFFSKETILDFNNYTYTRPFDELKNAYNRDLKYSGCLLEDDIQAIKTIVNESIIIDEEIIQRII
ncbi:MAG: hypothetical protein HQK97_03870 [Nitrospirae bacterium]|nr:hypothetical protein [Nitrospirota bacterium]